MTAAVASGGAQAARCGEGARGFTVIIRAVQSRGNRRSFRSASVDWVASAARRADDPRQARLHTRRARAVPLAAQAVRSRTEWQSSGEPSSGGWPTPRGSCATIEIGVRSDARPGSLSAVLGNECANPTHDRVAELRQSFREIRPSLAIALALLVVRLRHVRVTLGRSERASSALVRAPSVQGCSGVLGHQLPARAAAIRSR